MGRSLEKSWLCLPGCEYPLEHQLELLSYYVYIHAQHTYEVTPFATLLSIGSSLFLLQNAMHMFMQEWMTECVNCGRRVPPWKVERLRITTDRLTTTCNYMTRRHPELELTQQCCFEFNIHYQQLLPTSLSHNLSNLCPTLCIRVR